MKDRIKENRNFIVAGSIVSAVMLLFLLYYANLKSGFHMDELLTYGLSNSYYQPFPFEFGSWLDSSYYHDYLTVNDADVFAYGSVYSNQVADVHPPLYYMVFHTISSLFRDTFTKWTGLGINIFLFFLVAFSIYFLVKYITKDRVIGLITAAFWGFSVGAVSSVMFIRMYVLLTLWFVLFLYVTTKLAHEEKNNNKLFLSLYAVTVMGTLTQYYFLIGAFFISVILCLILMIQKRWKTFFSFAGTMFAGLVTSYLLFPAIIKHMTESNRGEESIENLASGTSYFREYINIVDRMLFAEKGAYFFIFLVTALGVAGVYAWKRSKVEFDIRRTILTVTMIFLPTLLYIILIQRIAPYRTPRYVFGILPAVVICIFFVFFILLRLVTKNLIVIRVVLALFAAGFTILTHQNRKVDYLYQDFTSVMETVKEHQNNDAVIIEDATWRVTGNILELREFNDILPLKQDPNNIDLPDNPKLSNNESLVVLIHDTFDQEEIAEEIMNKYGFNSYESLYKHNSVTGYLFN